MANVYSVAVCLVLMILLVSSAANTVYADSVRATVTVGANPRGVAFDSANGDVYVANLGSNTVSVISGSTNTAVGTPITVGSGPIGVAFDSTNGDVYVANINSDSVSVISGSTVVATVIVGSAPGVYPYGVAFDSTNGDVYVANSGSGSVSVISGSTVVATVTVGSNPHGVAFDSANGDVYVTNSGSSSVSVIAPTATYVSCTSSSFAVAASSSCTATVADTSGAITGETITFSEAAGTGSVTFSSSTCSLSAGGTCSVTVTGATTGSVTVKASYPGDSGNTPASGTFGLSVTSESSITGSQLPRIPPGVVPETLNFTTYGGTGLQGSLVGMVGGTMVEYSLPGFNGTLVTEDLSSGNSTLIAQAGGMVPLAISSCTDSNGGIRVSGFFMMRWGGTGLNSTEVLLGDYQSFVTSAQGWPAEPACGS